MDRFAQNLRRFVGWDVQYFAAVEPWRRSAALDADVDPVPTCPSVEPVRSLLP
jgi:hypothetical protein